VELEGTGRLQIVYSAFVKYLIKNGNKVQSASDIYIYIYIYIKPLTQEGGLV